MNAVIIKNSTTIAVKDNFKLDMKRDGSLDTCQITFTSTNYNLLNRYDRVTFNGQTWLVANVPTPRMNTESTPDWLYVVDLVERAAILKGYPMPQFTFTQDTAQTKTFRDAIENGLAKVETLFVGDTPRFNLKSTTTVSLSDIAPDEKYSGMDAYQFLKYYAEILDAKFVLDDNDEIDFIPLNDYNGTLTPTFHQIEVSRKSEDYATDIIMDLENVDAGEDNMDFYPHQKVFVHLCPLDLSNNIGGESFLNYRNFNNLDLTLPHKIKKIHRVTLFEKTPYEGDADFITNLDYGTFVFEEQEWKSLPLNSLWSWIPQTPWSSLRENSLYYQYGTDKVQNLQALKKHAPLISSTTGFAWSVFVKVEYEIYEELRVHRSSGVTLDGGYTYTERQNQNGNSVSLASETRRIENEIANKQAIQYNVMWTQSTIPSVRSRVSILGGHALITSLVVEAKGSVYHCSAQLASIYNKRSPLTKIISENRIFEIPSTQTVVRKITWSQNVKFSLSYNTAPTVPSNSFLSRNYGLFLNFIEDSTAVNPGMVALFAQYEYKTPYDETDAIAVMMPYNVTIDGDRMILIAKMTSNTSVDFQRDANISNSADGINTSARLAIVTDANGETNGIQFRFIHADKDTVVYVDDDENDIPLKEVYPIVSDGFFADGYINANAYTKKYFEIDNEIQSVKDRREQLQFEKTFFLSGVNDTTINARNIISVSKFRAEASAITLKVTIDGTEYTPTIVSKSYNADYASIGFTMPANGTMTLVKVYINALQCFEKVFSQSVTTGTRYIMLHIEE